MLGCCFVYLFVDTIYTALPPPNKESAGNYFNLDKAGCTHLIIRIPVSITYAKPLPEGDQLRERMPFTFLLQPYSPTGRQGDAYHKCMSQMTTTNIAC